MVKFFLRGTSYCTSYGQAGIILNRFQFIVKGHIRLIIKDITIIKICLTKALYIVISVDFGSRLCSFRRSSRVLLSFKDTIFRCSSNINLETSITPRCFWHYDWETLVLLNTNGRWYISFALRLKMALWACLVGSRFKFIFHWKSQLLFSNLFLNHLCHVQQK